MPSDPLQVAPVESPWRPRGPAPSAWRPAAAWYFLFCLIALAAGFWPGAIHPSATEQGGALPALRCLAVAQAAFFLLAYPLILARRVRLRGAARFWSSCAAESAVLLAAAAPLYAAAAWVSDALWTDCLRAALAVACLCPLAWSAGLWVARGRGWAGAAMIGLLVAAVGLPWACYVCLDFAGAERGAAWLWQAAPATLAWNSGAPRGEVWWPRPPWACVTWLAVAAAGALLVSILRAHAPAQAPGGSAPLSIG